jgi:hypothetical protein
MILMRLLELVFNYSDPYAASVVVSCVRLLLIVTVLHLNNDGKADGGQLRFDPLLKIRSVTNTLNYTISGC